MSNEGRLSDASAPIRPFYVDANWVCRHRGATPEFIERYGKLAQAAVDEGIAGLRDLAPDLVRLISDARTLRTAWEHLAKAGGQSPGRDGCRYSDFHNVHIWQWCRGAQDDLRKNGIQLGEEVIRRIPKSPGPGIREISVQSIFDRVIQRACVEVLQPLLDPLFDPSSFGYRPQKGPQRALATLDSLYRKDRPHCLVSVDIRNAFPSVPVGRLMGVLRKYFPDDDLLTFIENASKSQKRTGLQQGSPLSPLLLNLYLHELLDRKWRMENPDIPLLRFADDIVLVCKNSEQARGAYRDLVARLRPNGFKLKEAETDAIRDVSTGQAVTWMGYAISVSNDQLIYTVTDEAWASLADKFDEAHDKPNSPIAMSRSLHGWIEHKGPCYETTDMPRAYTRIKRLAKERGFEDILEDHEVQVYWQRAFARWCKLRKRVASAGGV